MDKVQIYETVLLALCAGVSISTHGQEKKGKENAGYFLAATLISLPTIGRIYGWW